MVRGFFYTYNQSNSICTLNQAKTFTGCSCKNFNNDPPIEVSINQSWFGTLNQDFEYIFHYDVANTKFELGITKVNHQNSIGGGVIGQIIVSVDNETLWDTITLEFSVSDILMQNSEAFALPVGINTAMTSFTITNCVRSLDITNSTSLQPNHTA